MSPPARLFLKSGFPHPQAGYFCFGKSTQNHFPESHAHIKGPLRALPNTGICRQHVPVLTPNA